jgi:L-rhamnose mutarotase
MHRIAFKMQLFKGFEEEYKKRHDELWPELENLLKESGVSDYSIFLDETTNSLFAIMKAADPEKLKALPSTPVMQKWWKHMADVMETNPDHSPVQVSMKEVFHLP